MDKAIKIGLLGLGTVGRGVYQLLSRENEVMLKRLGRPVKIAKILVRQPEKERGIPVPAELITVDADSVVLNKEIDLVVEVIGGTGIAGELVKKAMSAGKHVVTANKELLASHGDELFALAEKTGVTLGFEACVGAGIPIIHPLKECLVGNRIQRVMGIINGTTNFILSKMDGGSQYKEALAEAQALGYAERDPTNDIEGIDAAAKIAILASIAFNSRVTASEVSREGIGGIGLEDIKYARELGYAIKLLALAKRDGGELDVRVHPTMIPLDHPLAAVKEAYNAIFVEGDAVGELMFFGQGAGSLPTASAVVADVFAAASYIVHESTGGFGCTCFNDLAVKPIEKVESCYYLLVEAIDKPGVLAQIAKVFGDNNVSVGSVIQKETSNGVAEVVFMTHKVSEGDLRAALTGMTELPAVRAVRNVIRVEAERE